MKNAPIEYSNAIVVPDVSASQPASGMPAMPASPVSDRVGPHREAQQRVVGLLERGVVMAVMDFLSSWVDDRFRSRRRNL